MLLLAVRHAQSLGNLDPSVGLNPSLSPLGIRQAEALADRLSCAGMSAIYSSPFQRCIETAAPIAGKLGIPIHIRPDIAEYHHRGATDVSDHGLPQIEQLTTEAIGPCPDWREAFTWPSVNEALADLVRRTRAFADFLKARWTRPEDTVLVISHGSPIARLIDAWLSPKPGPSFRFIIDNAALCSLRFHCGVSSLICLNEHSHLIGLPVPAMSNFNEDGLPKPLPPSPYW